jgi:hypothetical protein
MGNTSGKRDASPSLAGGSGASNHYQNNLGLYGNPHFGFGPSPLSQDP